MTNKRKENDNIGHEITKTYLHKLKPEYQIVMLS
jgi:hypothetical protein